MSVHLSCKELAAIVSGSCEPSAEQICFQGVEYDSRQIKGGELFVALKGEKCHGHQFVKTALERGAALCLVEKGGSFGPGVETERLVVVPDTFSGFWQLARAWRRKMQTPIVAVTGSVGKTMVKELCASCLLRSGRGLYSLKSFNNHVGVPYTLCGLGPEHGWAVLEVGMNHAGEISRLVRICEPSVGVITRIAPVHQEFFSSLDAIADAKCELLEGLAPGSPLVINGDDPALLAAVDRKDPGGRLKRLTFGAEGRPDLKIVKVEEQGLKSIEVELEAAGTSFKGIMPVLGRHNAYNLAAAVLAAQALKPSLDWEHVRSALKCFVVPQMRLNVHTTKRERVIVDDSYNANPVSMRAMLELAGSVQASGKRVALVLGDMLELGPTAAQYHHEVAVMAAAIKPVVLVAVGKFADLFAKAAESQGVLYRLAENPEAAAHLAAEFDWEVLFVKASRGVALDRTVKSLLETEGEVLPGSA